MLLYICDCMICANSGKNEFGVCNSDFVNLIEGVKTLKDPKEQLAQLCCGYAATIGCFREKAKKVKKCTDKRTDTLIDFFRSISDNAINMICGDYTDAYDKCDHVKLVKRKSKNASKSFAKPLVYILSNL